MRVGTSLSYRQELALAGQFKCDLNVFAALVDTGARGEDSVLGALDVGSYKTISLVARSNDVSQRQNC